ncbi:VOC family protein [Pararhodobacter zhoushanensis]|uniref:VOC family protein n=1 Tax=Pararhodobacter zhoushanensis TaxID=2479545 RepID=A0ABT3H031_9RHOB|nr:VOC family protein [Pararhodobacter zhoushanensis]MCW1933141.1 VOC family protein [Pararhodobacter zhoushanensis]
MSLPINGLHHVTSIASNAQQNNDFFTKTLGLRRVKKTVNFDSPETYHLYYGDEKGTPGSVMTYFPFRGIGKAVLGTGEVGETHFSVPKGALGYWQERLGAQGVSNLSQSTPFGEKRLSFTGPDGDIFALIETDNDTREGWTGAGVSNAEALRGFQGVSLRLRDGDATAELLRFMGYDKRESDGSVTRYGLSGGNGADVVDIDVQPGLARGQQGAGSVHHLAFSVKDRAAQLEVRKALMDTGYQVTPVIDRDYFWAIYFRTPGGVLFEVATAEPGFDRDEDLANLGTALKLPTQHEALRARIEDFLPPITD